MAGFFWNQKPQTSGTSLDDVNPASPKTILVAIIPGLLQLSSCSPPLGPLANFQEIQKTGT